MEHDAALSASADLSDAAARMVVGLFLPAAFVVRRTRNVFSRATMDGKQFRRRVRRNSFFIQRLHIQPAHVAEPSWRRSRWMPWVVLAVELAWRDGGRKIILAALAGAMQMLAGGPEIIFFTWILLLALWIQQFVKSESPRRRMLWRFPTVVALVIALTAVQLLPFLDLVAHSQRESGFADLRWSMPGCAAGRIFSCRWRSARRTRKEFFSSTVNIGLRRITSASARFGSRCWRCGHARTPRLAARRTGVRRTDFRARRKHAGFSRAAKIDSAIEPRSLIQSNTLPSSSSPRRCLRRLRWPISRKFKSVCCHSAQFCSR